MKELVELVKQWSIDRNLHTQDPARQFLKVVEEWTEYRNARDDWDEPEVRDGVGDTLVTLIILCQQLGIDIVELKDSGIFYREKGIPDVFALGNIAKGLARDDIKLVEIGIIGMYRSLRDFCIQEWIDFESCLSAAYDEIKCRKGKMVNGTFVKEDDLHGTDK